MRHNRTSPGWTRYILDYVTSLSAVLRTTENKIPNCCRFEESFRRKIAGNRWLKRPDLTPSSPGYEGSHRCAVRGRDLLPFRYGSVRLLFG
ncbi:hypothetical protein T02_9276 [Trichinella nativa]|uniref:Uncharacterized protein n=1 Tax=Trichinella nativa TaxID=6335 RepID=A0A0V1LTE7_9BILA|nr:hypothetical protein T02_9276 [Trichinella nativa]